MRIIHVVTVVDPDASYGGPIRVALNQCRELSAQGHDVVLAASAKDFRGALPEQFDGVPVKLFAAMRILPGAGFAGLTSPKLLWWLRGAIPKADVVHIHAARDFITLPAALIAASASVPYVLQTHGMIDPSSNPLAVPLDLLVTRRVLDRASRVFHLTETERADLNEVAKHDLGSVELQNGVPMSEVQAVEKGAVEVLYLARLQERKRPLLFVKMAVELLKEHPEAIFTLVGPDEGEGKAVLDAIREANVGHSIKWEGPLSPDKTLDRLCRASVFVLPSMNEPFPMAVLEAMSTGLPVIVPSSCGLAATVKNGGAGAVFDGTYDSLVSMVEPYLSDAELRRAHGVRARELVERNFSMRTISTRLEGQYADSAGEGQPA
ncbi:glycosyltransferase [Arthrobacter sp. D2-10]